MARPAIYLDNHSTTRVDPRVVDVMIPYFSEKYGNASSVNHGFGHEAGEAVETAREQIANLLGTDAKSMVFTSGATEANNLALLGVLRASKPGSHLIVNAAEHKAILDPAAALKAEGFEVSVVPVNSHGMVDPDQIASNIRPNTVLVSTMWANNEVGTINPIAEIGAICRNQGILFHTDATQASGCIPIDLKNLPVDLLSLSAHKIYGPKGVGALFVRRGTPRIKIQAIIFGGGHERKLRSGTLPVPLIVGMGTACELCRKEMKVETDRLIRLREQLWQTLQDNLKEIQLNGHPTNRLPGNANVSFEGVNSEALMMQLKDIVAVSSGSACTTADPEPSHVLTAMALPLAQIESTLRFGLGRFTTSEEIAVVAAGLVSSVNKLRRLV